MQIELQSTTHRLKYDFAAIAAGETWRFENINPRCVAAAAYMFAKRHSVRVVTKVLSPSTILVTVH